MTVSYGPSRLLADLVALGHPAELRKSPKDTLFVIMPAYRVELGRFAGRTIDLALQATADFPKTVSSAIHVRATPHLFEKSDSIPNVRNIVDSELGTEWRYWSHNFGWSDEKSARRLMSQINQIFQRA